MCIIHVDAPGQEKKADRLPDGYDVLWLLFIVDSPGTATSTQRLISWPDILVSY